MTVHVVEEPDGMIVAGPFKSDAEAVRWWQLEGQPGDWLLETGEHMSELERELRLDR